MRHETTTTVTRILTLAALVALALSPPGSAQSTIDQSQEGYDLMKQIVTEKPKPNLLLVLDTSGSMALTIKGQQASVDSLGSAPWATWVLTGCTGAAATPTPSPTLTPTNTPPTPTYTVTPTTPWWEITPTETPTPTIPVPTATRTPIGGVPTATNTPYVPPTNTPVLPPTPTRTPTPYAGPGAFVADAGAALDKLRAVSAAGLISPFTAGVASSVLAPVQAAVAPALAAPAPALPVSRLAVPRPAAPAGALPLLAAAPWSDPTGTYRYLATGEDFTLLSSLYCTQWEYTLIIHQSMASRMATMKNALGSNVTIAHTEWQPPDDWPDFSPAWRAGSVVPGEDTPQVYETKPWVPLRSTKLNLWPTGGACPYRFDLLRSFYFPLDWKVDATNPERLYLEWEGGALGSWFDLGTLASTDNVNGRFCITPVGSCWGGTHKYDAYPARFPTQNVIETKGGSRIYGSTGWWKTYTWKVVYPGATANPGPPFVAYTATGNPLTENTQAPLVGSWDQDVPPGKVIENAADRVNWGLMHFPMPNQPLRATFPNNKETMVQPSDTSDSGDITAILEKLDLCGPNSSGACVGTGFNAFGATPTLAALRFAQEVVQKTADGGILTDITSQTFNLPPDPKFACDRINGVILVTDGLSNIFNPAVTAPTACYTAGGNWQEPCLACSNTLCKPTCNLWSGGPGCPDGGESGFNCPDNYTAFVAGEAEKLWDLTSATNQPGMRMNVRTWTIGLSTSVGPCELNYTAYMGRTDASDPNGKAGFEHELDPYLPNGTGDTDSYDAPTCPSQRPPHGHYAYFTNSADDLRKAILGIIGAVGVGDYTTAAPAVGSANTSLGDVGLVASSSYPSWAGHVYALKLDQDCSGANALNCQKPCGETGSNCVWDAGEVLSENDNNGVPRKIYTWDPTDATEPYKLVEVTVANLATLKKLFDSGCPTDPDCEFTAEVVDFIRGNDGAGNPRPWKLGAILNSTPAVLGPPELWRQNTLYGHASFESDYSTRQYMAWVGSGDGMVHGIDFEDGAEIIALLPPNLLDRQVQLYDKFIIAKNDPVNPRVYPVGQDEDPGAYIYGPNGSPRYADVFFPLATECGDTNGCYRTVMYLTEGPGGTGVHAIDITHAWARDANGDGTLDSTEKDPNYEEARPVRPLWSKTRDGKAGTGAVSELGYTWSVPALGGSTGALDSPANEWELLMGGGWDERLSSGVRKSPLIRMDPRDGTVKAKSLFDGPPSGTLVYNQSFADAVIWATDFPVFRPDNIVNMGVQVDLNGQMFFMPKDKTWNPDNKTEDLGAANPMYYPPAVAAYPATGAPTRSLYGFSTGSFYERDEEVSGISIGVAPNFIPSLHVMSRDAVTNAKICRKSIAITDVPLPSGTGTLSNTAQPSGAPLIISPLDTMNKPVVLFLVFDPLGSSCNGLSYIVRVDFDPASCDAVLDSYEAGIGAAGGFAIAGKKVIVTRSYVGSDGRAAILEVPDIQLPANTVQRAVRWWYELQ